jgi:hypothetical protein
MANCAFCIDATYYTKPGDCSGTPSHGSINVIQPAYDQYYTCMHTIDIIVRGRMPPAREHIQYAHQYRLCIADNLIQNQDYKIIQYQSAVYIVYRISQVDPWCDRKSITDYIILTPVDNQQQEQQLKQQQKSIEIQEADLKQLSGIIKIHDSSLKKRKDQLKEQKHLIKQQADQLAEKDRIIIARTTLNKRLIDTLLIYKHKQPDGPTYNYHEIKSRKQKLHWEFKRLSKLMKLGK